MNDDEFHIDITPFLNEPEPEMPELLFDLSRFGAQGRILGVFFCGLWGSVAGAMGSLLVWLFIRAFLAGLIGEPEPGIFSSVISGGWFTGLFGLVPGLFMGIAIGLSNSMKYVGISYVISIVLGCGSLIAFGYPTTILGYIFYFMAPFGPPWISHMTTTALKVRLGLVPPEVASSYLKEETDFIDG